MLLPIFQAEGREDPCCPLEIWSHGCYQTELSPVLELLQPMVAVGTLMSGSSCCLTLQQIQTLQSQPWLLVDFFALCSKFLSAVSVVCYQLVQREAETQEKAIPKMPMILPFVLLSCPGDLAQMLCPCVGYQPCSPPRFLPENLSLGLPPRL